MGVYQGKLVFWRNYLILVRKRPDIARSIDLVSVRCSPTLFFKYLMLNESLTLRIQLLGSWSHGGSPGEILILAKLLDFRMKNTLLQPGGFDLVSVGCSPTIFLKYLMLNKSIDFENSTPMVLESWGFTRGNFVFGEITSFQYENTLLQPGALTWFQQGFPICICRISHVKRVH